MKKLITITLSLALTLTLTLILAACGGDTPAGNKPAANDTPQVQGTAEPTPTEVPVGTSTPETTPDPTPEATPDDNSGGNNTGNALAGTEFFPGIDDSLLPDDNLKIIVGTLDSAEHFEENGETIIEIIYREVNQEGFAVIFDQFYYEADDAMQDGATATFTYSWGTINTSYDNSDGRLDVTITVR